MTADPIPEWVHRYQTTTPPLPGWFSRDDLHLFALINQIQLATHVAGDLLEVGAYLGKSSVALGFMRREDESLTIVDPWDSKVDLEENLREQERLYDEQATREMFLVNYRRFHTQLPAIRQGVSSEQLKHLPDERFRFIHIDGSHEWSAVSGDVDQVLRVLSPGGVVAFDDLFSRHCAGVGAAVWPACANGDLVPIATTNKIYATRGPSSSVNVASVAKAIEDDSQLRILGRHPIFGRDVLEVTTSPFTALRRLRRYVPPVLIDVAIERNFGQWVLRRFGD